MWLSFHTKNNRNTVMQYNSCRKRISTYGSLLDHYRMMPMDMYEKVKFGKKSSNFFLNISS